MVTGDVAYVSSSKLESLLAPNARSVGHGCFSLSSGMVDKTSLLLLTHFVSLKPPFCGPAQHIFIPTMCRRILPGNQKRF
jgi:hypothetical protein